jgi:hypothetical protein
MNLFYCFWRNDAFKTNTKQIIINPFSFKNNYIFVHLIRQISVCKSLFSSREDGGIYKLPERDYIS